MAKLGDICEIVSGSTPKTNNDDFWNGNLCWITPAEITDNDIIIFDSERKITESGAKSCALTLMPVGTVLLSSRAPIGKVAITGIEMYCNQGFKNLICSDSVFNKYLFWFLKCNTEYLNSLGRGATFKEISKRIVSEIDIPLPPLEIQHQIASNLDKVTHLIDLCNAILEKLDLLVKSRFVEMFGDTEINSHSYPVKKLSNICTVSSSKRIYQDEQSNKGVPFLRISNLVDLIETNCFKSDLFIPEDKYSELFENGLVPQKGDILVTSRGTLGKCYIIQENDKFYFQDGMISWLYDIDKSITPLYLTLLFDTRDIKRQINNLQSGSTVAYLSIAMLKKLDIVVPPLALQKQFTAFVAQTDKSKFTVAEIKNEIRSVKIYDQL